MEIWLLTINMIEAQQWNGINAHMTYAAVGTVIRPRGPGASVSFSKYPRRTSQNQRGVGINALIPCKVDPIVNGRERGSDTLTSSCRQRSIYSLPRHNGLCDWRR